MTLFNQKMTLQQRVKTGEVDSHNQPVYQLCDFPIRGTFWQESREDRDSASPTVAETQKAGFLPCSRIPKAGDAILASVEGESYQWEIVGPPEPKFHTRGKSGRVHHWEVQIRSAKA